jgi:hypothetical protein
MSSSAGDAIDVAAAPEMVRIDPLDTGPVEARASHTSIDNNIAPRTQLDVDYIVIDTNQKDGTSSSESVRPRTDKWVPMAGWGEPKPQKRPKAPRESQEDLPAQHVIYDDGTQLRVEDCCRRPKRILAREAFCLALEAEGVQAQAQDQVLATLDN